MNQRFLCNGCEEERGMNWAYAAHMVSGKKRLRRCGIFEPKKLVPSAEPPARELPPAVFVTKEQHSPFLRCGACGTFATNVVEPNLGPDLCAHRGWPCPPIGAAVGGFHCTGQWREAGEIDYEIDLRVRAEDARTPALPGLTMPSLETPKCERCRQTLQTKDSLIVGRCAFCRAKGARDAAVQALPAVKATNPKDAVGIKKTPFWLVPATVVAEIALALLEGARKYGAYNWRVAGVRASVYISATEGHMKDWWEGEDTDPESQLSHITKALASLTCLRDAMIQGMVEDDRPPKSKILPRQGNNARAAEIIERVRPNDPVPPYTEKDKVPR